MIDTWWLVLVLIFSSVGLGYFIYGRKQSNVVARYCGIVLVAYPYFFDNNVVIFGVGVVLMALPKFVEL